MHIKIIFSFFSSALINIHSIIFFCLFIQKFQIKLIIFKKIYLIMDFKICIISLFVSCHNVPHKYIFGIISNCLSLSKLGNYIYFRLILKHNNYNNDNSNLLMIFHQLYPTLQNVLLIFSSNVLSHFFFYLTITIVQLTHYHTEAKQKV